jgi:hypothetical protein
MGEVWRGTYHKPAEDIRDRKVVVVPKVEGKIFTYTLKSKNFLWNVITNEMDLSFISETSKNYELSADSQGKKMTKCTKFMFTPISV